MDTIRFQDTRGPLESAQEFPDDLPVLTTETMRLLPEGCGRLQILDTTTIPQYHNGV